MRKKGAKKNVSQQRSSPKSMIKEALADINKEILNINREKRNLNKQIKGVDTDLGTSRKFERDLQQKIAKLLEKEAFLKEKKKGISQKEENLGDKLSKIEKIKFELNDL